MNNFASDRKYIENEFEQAAFDKSTGLSPEDLILCLREIQESQCDIPRPLVCAVTHVLINDPTTGYGIFIENMLNAAQMPMGRAA